MRADILGKLGEHVDELDDGEPDIDAGFVTVCALLKYLTETAKYVPTR